MLTVMRLASVLLLLFAVVGCQPIANLVDQAKSLVGLSANQTQNTPSTQEYRPELPPAIEEDKTVQVTPEERFLTLMEQFNRTPDETLRTLTLEEFNKVKESFTTSRDARLVTALYKSIPNLQTKDVHTIQLLVDLLPLLKGENRDYARAVLARGFEFATVLTLEALAKKPDDSICYLSTLIPAEVSAEDKLDFLKNRLVTIDAAKAALVANPQAVTYANSCTKTLDLHLYEVQQGGATNSAAAPKAEAAVIMDDTPIQENPPVTGAPATPVETPPQETPTP